MKTWLLAIGLLASTSTLSANLYRAHSPAHAISELALSVLPQDMVVVVKYSTGNPDPIATTDTAQNAQIARIDAADSKLTPQMAGASELIAIERPGAVRQVCVLYLRSRDAHDPRTRIIVLHEAMHCKTLDVNIRSSLEPYFQQITREKLSDDQGRLISGTSKAMTLLEVLAESLLVAQLSSDPRWKELEGVQNTRMAAPAYQPYVNQSAGYVRKSPAYARFKLQLASCSLDRATCSAGTQDFLQALLSDPVFQENSKADIVRWASSERLVF